MASAAGPGPMVALCNGFRDLAEPGMLALGEHRACVLVPAATQDVIVCLQAHFALHVFSCAGSARSSSMQPKCRVFTSGAPAVLVIARHAPTQ